MDINGEIGSVFGEFGYKLQLGLFDWKIK